MCRADLVRQIVLALGSGMVLVGASGQGCFPAAPDPAPAAVTPDPVTPAPVTVELVNATSNQVQPYLWADQATLNDSASVVVPQNAIHDVNDGAPLAVAGDKVTVTLTCLDAGTLVADGDLLLAPTGTPEPSSNILLLQEGRDFQCGDTVSFYYEVDVHGSFFTSVDVNGVYLAP